MKGCRRFVAFVAFVGLRQGFVRSWIVGPSIKWLVKDPREQSGTKPFPVLLLIRQVFSRMNRL